MKLPLLTLCAIGTFFFSCLASAQSHKIGASLLTQQHPFYIELATAMREEAQANDAALTISIANQDLNKQLSDVEDFIVRQMDVIIISPVDSRGVVAALAKAQAAGWIFPQSEGRWFLISGQIIIREG